MRAGTKCLHWLGNGLPMDYGLFCWQDGDEWMGMSIRRGGIGNGFWGFSAAGWEAWICGMGVFFGMDWALWIHGMGVYWAEVVFFWDLDLDWMEWF